MRKSNADTHVIWHVTFRPEIADVTGVDGGVTGKLSTTHLQLDRDPADGWNLCTDSIRPLVRDIFDLGGCLLRRMSAGSWRWLSVLRARVGQDSATAVQEEKKRNKVVVSFKRLQKSLIT